MAEAEVTPTIESTDTQPEVRDMASVLYPAKPEEEPEQPEVEKPKEEITAEGVKPETEVVAKEETPSEEAAESEEEIVSSLSQLIEHEGWDPEWVNDLKVPVKVNGVKSEAKLADLVKNYQIGQAAEQRLEEAKSKAQLLHQEAEQQGEAVKVRVAEAAGLLQLAERLFSVDAEQANLQKLRDEGDEVGYLAAKDRLMEKRRAIESVKQAAAKVFKDAQLSTANDGLDEEHIGKERVALRNKIPEWSDQEVANSESVGIFEYLTGDEYGFTQEDVESAGDHRLFLLARKAWKYDQQQAKVQTAQKRVLTIPKVMNPGSKETKGSTYKPKDAPQIL